MEKNINDIYYNLNDGNNSSEELVHTLPIIAGDGPIANMETNKIISKEKMREEVRDYAILISIDIHM